MEMMGKIRRMYFRDKLSLHENRDRGEPISSAPPTPPGMRVRTGRFEKLRFHESLGTPNRSK